MRPIFTIHAGEFVFGKEVEKRFPNADLWVPVKDRGIDFLITDSNRTQTVAVQVKMSRDYRPNQITSDFEKARIAGGWFTFSHKKLSNSPADIWSIVLISRERRTKPYFVNLSPKTLLGRLEAIHGERDSYHLYPWIIESKKERIRCVEGRGLKKKEKQMLTKDELSLGDRDFTGFLDCWKFMSWK